MYVSKTVVVVVTLLLRLLDGLPGTYCLVGLIFLLGMKQLLEVAYYKTFKFYLKKKKILRRINRRRRSQ
jgi:hypothetical protein